MHESLKPGRIFLLVAAMSVSIFAFATQDHSYKYRSPQPMPAHMLKTNFIR